MTTTMDLARISAENNRQKAVQRRRETFRQRVVYALLIGGAVMFMLPLIVMLSTSLKPLTEINTYPPSFVPKTVLLANYPDAWTFENTNFPR